MTNMLLIKQIQHRNLILPGHQEVKDPKWVNNLSVSYKICFKAELNQILNTDLSEDELVGKEFITESPYHYGDTYYENLTEYKYRVIQVVTPVE